MVLWLQCKAVVFLCGRYLDWLSQESASAGWTDSHSHSDLDLDLGSEEATEAAIAATPTEKLRVRHVLAKTPVHPHQSVQDIVGAHGTTDFLLALHSFLHTYLLGNTLIPGVQDCFDIYSSGNQHIT